MNGITDKTKKMEENILLIKDLWFDEKRIHFLLSDNRIVSIPRDWFSKLENATNKQLTNWKLIANGIGVHWSDLDEDLSAKGLLSYKPSNFKYKNIKKEAVFI